MKIVPHESGGRQKFMVIDHDSYREYQALVALIQQRFSAQVVKSVDGPDASAIQLACARGSCFVIWDDVTGIAIGKGDSGDSAAAEEVAGFLAATEFPSV